VRLRLPANLTPALRAALQRAGRREIGGQLFGEQLAPSDFRITEIAYQKRPGTLARFVVDVLQATRDAVAFFKRTDHRYMRFNYLGEWHSHPAYEVRPSSVDIASMRDLVGHDSFKGHFAILMIVRLDPEALRCGAWLFDPLGREGAASLEIEP
jgi:proteasome lid subunit RPN8/RPN11